jgi:transketolase
LENYDIELIGRLEYKACDIRKKILTLAYNAGQLHVGGDLSMTDILVALYYSSMKHDPKNPQWPDRDKFVLSKGHGAGGLYTILADLGYFSEEELMTTYGKLESKFGMHPCKDTVPAGIEMSTGSLGHGLSGCVGMALAAKLDRQRTKVFTLLGDGETNEGSVWEAAMSASHFKLGNLVAIIDRNELSLDGKTEEIMGIEPLPDKWAAFGWHVITVDGNDMTQLLKVLASVPDSESDKPTCIIAKTIKGKGIPFMENKPEWHSGTVSSEILAECMSILNETQRNIKR